jgi:hypothetical protein
MKFSTKLNVKWNQEAMLKVRLQDTKKTWEKLIKKPSVLFNYGHLFERYTLNMLIRVNNSHETSKY